MQTPRKPLSAPEMTLQAIKWSGDRLEILDQLLLPQESKYIPVNGVEDGWKAINSMQVTPNLGAHAQSSPGLRFKSPSLVCSKFALQ